MSLYLLVSGRHSFCLFVCLPVCAMPYLLPLPMIYIIILKPHHIDPDNARRMNTWVTLNIMTASLTSEREGGTRDISVEEREKRRIEKEIDYKEV